MTTFCIAFYESYLSTVQPEIDWRGGGGDTIHMQNAYMYEILVDWKFFAQFVRSQVTSWGMADFLCFKLRLRKNVSTKRGSFGKFLIRIQIRNPDLNPNSDPASNLDPDSKLTAGRIRIRIRIRNLSFGSATLRITEKYQAEIAQP